LKNCQNLILITAVAIDTNTCYKTFIMEYKGYKIEVSKGHGKNVKGNKKTETMRVLEDLGNGMLIKKQFSYSVNNLEKQNLAIKKCKMFIDTMVSENVL